MNKILITLTLFSALMLNVNYSEAQSCSDTTFTNCVDSNVETCRNASTCNPYEHVLTLSDVNDLAITNCCGKTSKVGRNLCLIRERNKYLPAVASGSQRAFFRAARAKVNNVRKNVCKNSTYELDTDSALF